MNRSDPRSFFWVFYVGDGPQGLEPSSAVFQGHKLLELELVPQRMPTLQIED